MVVTLKRNPNGRFECFYEEKYIVTLLDRIPFILICNETGDKVSGRIVYHHSEGYIWVADRDKKMQCLHDGMLGFI